MAAQQFHYEYEHDMSPSEDSDDDDFGQRLPPLHVYLKRVLDKYPEGGQILKELLQNADDAGARRVIFLYDQTQHPTEHLWSQSLNKFNGPALYVFNDATFKKSDWYNIQHPEQSGKYDDPTKIGRFGLGFISVYHLTDMPSVFSGTQVGFLDPHERYFTVDPITGVREKGKRGKKWRISSELLEHNMRDQFSPFMSSLFECDEENFIQGEYPGTIFRFPLRKDGMGSKVSKVCYDDGRIANLFQSFQNDAEISLLFLKNVTSISVYKKKALDHCAELDLLYEFEVSQETRSKLLSERLHFLQMCHLNSGRYISRSDFNINRHLQFCGLQTQYKITDTNYYLIVNILKRKGLSKKLKELMDDTDLKQLPWVGVAARMSSGDAIEGRTFCFLPLPESERSHLPVHVHGYFGLGDNRRSIKWPDRESEHDKAARWNEQLIHEVFPEAYMELILQAISIGLPSDRVYQLWPEINTLSGAWKLGVARLIKEVSQREILFTEACGGSWKIPEDVYINTNKDKLIQKVMLRKGLPVVHVPTHVLTALKWQRVKLREVTPSLIRNVVRRDSLGWLTRKEKLDLLEYILKDGKFKDLENVHLLPLQDGNFVAF